MRTQSKVWTVGIAGAALLVGATLLFVVPVIRNPSAAARSSNTTSTTSTNAPSETTVAVQRIAPADVLDKGTAWAPLTGDGSN